MKILAVAFAFFSVVATASLSAQAQDPGAAQNPRIALVIGNSAYPDHPLATPANDAGLVAQTLQAAGFEVVGARDLDQNTLRGALRDFLTKAATIGPDMQAFVYLSGRGLQFEGDNYFVPVDAQIARDADVPIQAIKLSDFSRALAATPGRARMIVMDAARANSFAADGSPLAGGLGLVDPEDGTLMAFNAAPGTIAPDEQGPYGVYGKSLAGAMREGGLPIDDVFAQVRLQVNQQTNGGVVPWSISKVAEPYSIFERAPDAPPAPAVAAAAEMAKRPLSGFAPDEAYSVALQRDTLGSYQDFLAAYPTSPQARRVRAILAARREAIFWRRSVDDNSPRAYWTYLHVYPKGPHVPDARRRLRILSAQFAPPSDFAPVEYADLPPPPPDELSYDTGPTFVFDGPDYGPPPPPPPYAFLPEQDDGWRNLPPPPPPTGAGYLPVLSIAIPLLIGAKVIHDHNFVRTQQNVGAPPPLPHAFKAHDHAPGANDAAPVNPAQPLESGKTSKSPSSKTEPSLVKPTGQPGAVVRPLTNQVEPLTVNPTDQPVDASKPAKPGFGKGQQHDLKGAPLDTKLAPEKDIKGPQGLQPASQDLKSVHKDLKAAPLDSKSAPQNDIKTEPLNSQPASQGLKPMHKDLKAAPLDSKSAPQNDIKTAPLDSQPASQDLKPVHKDLKAAPLDSKVIPQKEIKAAPSELKLAPQKEFKAAPLDSKPATQINKPAPQELKVEPVQHVAPVVQPAASPPPRVAPPVQHVAPPPPAAGKAPPCGPPPKPACPR